MKTLQEVLDYLFDDRFLVTDENLAANSMTPHQARLKELGILVLGEIEGPGTKKIACFCPQLGKQVEIPNIKYYSLDHLVQDFGEGVEEKVNDSREPIAGTYRMADVRRALAAEASKHTFNPKDRRGGGIWESTGRLMLVGSDEIALANGGLERVVVPSVDGHLVEFRSVEPWFDYDTLERHYAAAMDPKWCQGVLDELISLFGRWNNWTHRYDPQLVASLVLCTWLQTVWDWRPLVAVTGPTNSGKSMLLQNTLTPMFGKLALFAQKPTEAGVRQAVKRTAKALILDEFESDKHRQQILDLFRTSSRGGKMLRGTANQDGTEFGLSHIPWTGAIETGLRRAADRNRFIVLDLKAVVKKPGDPLLVIPPAPDLEDLGQRALAVAMRHWRRVKDRCRDLMGKGAFGVDHRVIESYSLPCAMLGSVLGMDVDTNHGLLTNVLEDRDVQSLQESDEERLLNEIWESTVFLERGKTETVSNLLREDYDDYVAAGPALEKVGIKVIHPRSDVAEQVFFVQRPINRVLLKDSDFKWLQIEQILLRVPGAKRVQQRIAGKRPWGVCIPRKSIEDLIGSDRDESIF